MVNILDLKSINYNQIQKGPSPVAIVLGLNVTGLCIIRSLGRRNIPVIAIDSNIVGPSSHTKYSKNVLCTQLFDEPLLECLITLGRHLNTKAVLFPANDLSVLTICKYRADLNPYYEFVLPDEDVTELLINKKKFHEYAVKNEYNVPNTYFISDLAGIQMASDNLEFPCIIKPEYRDEIWNAHFNKKNIITDCKEDFINACNLVINYGCKVIVQEWIAGSDSDIFFCLAYIDRNFTPLAVFTGRKIRQYPVYTGSTSIAESIWQPEVAKQAIKVLSDVQCVGLCSVEFKNDRKNGNFKIIEPTVGRVNLQEALSVHSGMDIPFIAYQDALGRDPHPFNSFKEGIKWIYEEADLFSVLEYRRQKQITLKEYLASLQGKRSYALFASDDLKPFLSFVLNTSWHTLKRLRSLL